MRSVCSVLRDIPDGGRTRNAPNNVADRCFKGKIIISFIIEITFSIPVSSVVTLTEDAFDCGEEFASLLLVLGLTSAVEVAADTAVNVVRVAELQRPILEAVANAVAGNVLQMR
jgi:hypothetical protein